MKSKEELKKETENYLKEHKLADTEELLINLNADLRVLVEVLDELEEEGKIEYGDDTNE